MESRGNWAQVVPMALYFVRCMPNRSTGLSPFKLKHGWEPITPLQVLYKGWVQKDLGPIDIEEWVIDNADKVQHMRNVVVVFLTTTSEQLWNKTAQTRQFEKSGRVYMRKSGLNTKLLDSWEGPYVVEKETRPFHTESTRVTAFFSLYTYSC